MGHPGVMSERAEGQRRRLAVLLALIMLVAHLFLMAHESRQQSHTNHALAVTSSAPMQAIPVAAPTSPTAPRSVLDGCPVAQATLPGALLLLLLTFLLGTQTRGVALTTPRSWWQLLRDPPPPLAPDRRRALLQVFLI
jgi:hypothetical protein